MAEPDVEPLDPETFGPGQPCFGCSPAHPIGLRLRFTREGDEVTTRFTPPPEYQGPPGIMHGGLVTTVADEIAAWTIVGLKRRFGFTAAIEARLLRPVRVGVELLGRGRITTDGSRLVTVAVTLAQEGADAFRGTFRFALLDEGGATRVLGSGAPLPEAWKRFCR